jgi:hypothetical protein
MPCNYSVCARPNLLLSRKQGFYGGVQVDSSVLKVRHDVNRDFYGLEISAQEILGDLQPPLAAQPLYESLRCLFAMFGVIDPTEDGDVQRRFDGQNRSAEDHGPPA